MVNITENVARNHSQSERNDQLDSVGCSLPQSDGTTKDIVHGIIETKKRGMGMALIGSLENRNIGRMKWKAKHHQELKLGTISCQDRFEHTVKLVSVHHHRTTRPCRTTTHMDELETKVPWRTLSMSFTAYWGWKYSLRIFQVMKRNLKRTAPQLMDKDDAT